MNIIKETRLVFDQSLDIKSNVELGYLKVSGILRAKNNNTEPIEVFNGYLQIYRACNSFSEAPKDDYALLSEIAFEISEGQAKEFSYVDVSAPMGEEIKYKVNFVFNHQYDETNSLIGYTESSNQAQTASSEVLVSDSIILTTRDVTLRVKFNPKVTGFKRNVVDVITPSIGGTYPVARRNAKQNYHTFTLGGLISIQTEEEDYLDAQAIAAQDSYARWEDNNVTIADIYSASSLMGQNATANFPYATWEDSFARLRNLFENNKITKLQYNDLMERVYRDRVYDFLYSIDIKLFKSLQEGNFFVYLSNITLTPEESVGRNMYSFSCTATEIEPTSAENYLRHFTFKED